MALAWTYSDYITYDPGSARLTRLRLHIQEVTDAIKNPQRLTISGKDLTKYDLRKYLEGLKAEEKQSSSSTKNNFGMTFFNTTQPGTR